LLAAVGKGRDVAGTVATVREVVGLARPLPRPLAALVAAGLIAYEAAIGIYFLVGRQLWYGAIATAVLIGVFVAASVLTFRRKAVIPCRCFGSPSDELGARTATRAGLLLIPVAICVLGVPSASSWWPHTLETTVVALSLLAAASLATRWSFAVVDLQRLAAERRQHATVGG
jgi:hypothetical protein